MEADSANPPQPGPGGPENPHDPADSRPVSITPDVGRSDKRQGHDDVDARFAEIVAELGDIPTHYDDATMLPAHRSWQTSEHVELLEDEQSHYIPPDPPPIFSRKRAGSDRALAVAWIGIFTLPLLGIVMLILNVALNFRVPQVFGWAGFVLFVACLIVAAQRMPTHRGQDPGGTV